MNRAVARTLTLMRTPQMGVRRMSSDPFHDKERAAEDLASRKRDEELLEKLRQSFATKVAPTPTPAPAAKAAAPATPATPHPTPELNFEAIRDLQKRVRTLEETIAKLQQKR